MDGNATAEPGYAVAVTADDLKKLWKQAARIGRGRDGVTASVACSDKVEREFKTLEELLSYENPKSQHIQSLYIHGWDVSTGNRFVVQLGRLRDSVSAPAVEVAITAPVDTGI